MLRQVAPGQETAVDGGVQRLDSSVEQLGKAGNLLDIEHRYLGSSERGGRPAGGENLPAKIHQSAGKGDYPALVADGDQCARHEGRLMRKLPPDRAAVPDA